jgi:thioredoxin
MAMTFKQFILLGLPGVGVEAHGAALAERWHIPHVSMEALLRQAIHQGSAAGVEARPYVEAGEPVPDGLLMKLLRRRLEQPDAMLQGSVLTGFPDTQAQAQALDEWWTAVGQPPATVIYLKAMTGLLLNRLWTEKGPEETSASIRRRLTGHQEALEPVLEFYRLRSQLTHLNASLSFAEVARELAQVGCEAAGAARLIKDEAELDTLLAQEPLLVVDCMASWCGSCKQVAPLIDQLAEAFCDRVNVMKIDFDNNRQLSKRFGLKGMPAVMFFKDGQLQETLTGVKPYQTYSSALSRFLEP